MSKKRVVSLLDKYLKGECTEVERQRVLSWLDGLDNNSREWSVLSEESKREFIEKLYADIQAQMVPDASRKYKGNRWWYRVAAVLLVLITAGGFLYYMASKPTEDEADLKYVRTSTGIGETQLVRLEDGTQVWLNALSEIRYPLHFSENSRSVFITGEAFFKVVNDKRRPFIVHSGLLQTQVLGTSFNISAYSEDKKIEVAVLSGKVKVYSKTEKMRNVILAKNEKVKYEKEHHRLIKSQVSNSNDILAWQRKQLAFYHTPMTEVSSVFYRAFGIKIHFADRDVKQYELSGDFDMNQDPESILKAICLSIGGKYTKEGTEVIIESLKSH